MDLLPKVRPMNTQSLSHAAEERAPRMMARALTRKLQAQGFTDAQLKALAREILETISAERTPV